MRTSVANQSFLVSRLTYILLTGPEQPFCEPAAVNSEEQAQSPRSSLEQVKGRETSGNEACKQFHAVMKNAGLEAIDEEVLSIPELMGCATPSTQNNPTGVLSQSVSHPANQPSEADQDTNVDLNQARSIPVDPNDMMAAQGHDSNTGIGDKEASAVMDALKSPDILEGPAETLTEAATAAPTGAFPAVLLSRACDRVCYLVLAIFP